MKAGDDVGRVATVAKRLDAAHQLVRRAVLGPGRRELAVPAFDPLGLDDADHLLAGSTPLGRIGRRTRAGEQERS